MEKIEQSGENTRISGLEYFEPDRVFDCGQCFRFQRRPDGVWTGIALDRKLTVRPVDGGIEIAGCTPEQYNAVWRGYLGLADDYSAIRAALAMSAGPDRHLQLAMETGKGIRILRQPPFETLISFIISQNNNIGRIKKNIAALCAAFGEPVGTGISGISGGSTDYAFPTPERLAAADAESLHALGLGYRAEYVRDAARAVASGELDLSAIAAMDTPAGLDALCRIRGIGPKVASCVLLFGFAKDDAFPMDVWVRRLMARYYPGERDGRRFGRYAGIAQQYLFDYERSMAARSRESAPK